MLAALTALFSNVEVVWGAAISTSIRQPRFQSPLCIVGFSELFLPWFREKLHGSLMTQDMTK